MSRQFAVLLALLVLAAVVHRPGFSNGFLDFDDPEQIVENASIRSIDGPHLAEIFTTPVLGMYSPLATLSYALDYRVGGLTVTAYHATNLLLHLLSVTLVFLIVVRLAGSLTSAAIVAALFAVHPVHVAAVAPLMQRNGLLHCCFYLAAWLVYLSYLRAGRRVQLAWCFAIFMLALLSKAPAVVLPLLLLLTDFYRGRTWSMTLVLEKAPFFLASMVFGLIALHVRPDMAAMKGSVLDYSLVERVCLAAFSLVFYLVKLVLPTGLTGLYPYPAHVNGQLPALVYAAPFAAIAIVWLVARVRWQRRLLLFCGLFFLIHIALLLKIVPFGVEFVSDRYLYLPSIGVFFAVAELGRAARGSTYRAYLVAVSAVILVFAIQAHGRYADWKDNVTFYASVLARYPNSAVAENNLGGALDAEGRPDEAFAHYSAAARLEPGYVPPHVNLGNALARRGQIDPAIAEFNNALRLEPSNAKAHAGLGHALAQAGRLPEAIEHLSEAVRLAPGVAETHTNLGVALDESGRLEEAIAQYNAALALDPGNVEARINLGAALADQGRLDDAAAQFLEALRQNPGLADVHRNLGLLRARQGRRDEAIHEFETALRLGPPQAELHYNLAVLLKDRGDVAGAIEHLKSAIALAPGDQAARRLLDQLRR